MNELYQFISNYSEPMSIKLVLLSLLLSFVLSQTIAITYVWTFRGMSYSRSFVVTIALSGLIAAMLMLSINNSIAAGLGIAGSLAIIRFRTALRDPRDMLFIFASLAAGIAAGLRVYLAAIVGSAVFCLAVALLTAGNFGTQRKFDGLLRFQLPLNIDDALLTPILQKNTRYFAMVSLREAAQGQMMERAYQVQIADENKRANLIRELEAVAGIEAVSLLLQEPTVEI